jgi:serine/threonine-protein phosphatase PGAM5
MASQRLPLGFPARRFPDSAVFAAEVVHMRLRPLLISWMLLVGSPLAAVQVEPDAAARTIVLVRHGHYAPDPSADAELGPALTDLGIAQARLVGARLAGLPEDFDAVLASPMTRAQQTAKVIVSDLDDAGIETVADLAECTPPTRRKEITADMKPEELAECASQFDRLFAARFKPAQGEARQELMVCHGNVIRYLITRALDVDTEAWLEMSVGHVSMTTIRIEADGSMKLIAAGDVGHLPPNLRTGATGDPERALTVAE